jgi:hypothetical protein
MNATASGTDGGRRRGVSASWPAGRVCQACTTVLSIYNGDDLCASCAASVPLEELPTRVGRYL